MAVRYDAWGVPHLKAENVVDLAAAAGWVQANDRMFQLELMNLVTGKKTVIGEGLANDFAPSFSSDGRFLAFLSRRHFGIIWDDVQYQINITNSIKPYLLALNDDVLSPLTPKIMISTLASCDRVYWMTTSSSRTTENGLGCTIG